jgi:hypothetical protein
MSKLSLSAIRSWGGARGLWGRSWVGARQRAVGDWFRSRRLPLYSSVELGSSLPMTCCVTMGNLLNLSEPLLPCLKNGNNKGSHLPFSPVLGAWGNIKHLESGLFLKFLFYSYVHTMFGSFPLPPHLAPSPLPLPPTPSLPSRNYFGRVVLISSIVIISAPSSIRWHYLPILGLLQGPPGLGREEDPRTILHGGEGNGGPHLWRCVSKTQKGGACWLNLT